MYSPSQYSRAPLYTALSPGYLSLKDATPIRNVLCFLSVQNFRCQPICVFLVFWYWINSPNDKWIRK